MKPENGRLRRQSPVFFVVQTGACRFLPSSEAYGRAGTLPHGEAFSRPGVLPRSLLNLLQSRFCKV